MNPSVPDGPQPIQPRPAEQPPARSSPSSSGSSVRRGAFYSPPPSAAPPSSPPTASTKESALRKVAVGVIAAAAIGMGAWYGLSNYHPPTPAPAVAAATQAQKAFSVSRADLNQKATEQLKTLLAGGADTASAATDALHAANVSALMGLAKSNPQLAEEIKTGRRVLYSVYLLDFLAEDGDHAELSVDGVPLGDVYLKNAGTQILIPLTAGVPAQMKLQATADGGGGVTVGFISSLGEARTRIMQVGEFEQWQVTVQ